MAASRRFNWRQELALALLPTAIVLLMLCGVEAFSRQRLLFASLASSAFLIYVDPEHPVNGARTLVLAQGCAALIGFGADFLLGAGYVAAGAAMVVTIVVLIAANAMHPPAVSTSLTFAFRAGTVSSLSLFGLSMGLIVLLVALQYASLRLLRRFRGGGADACRVPAPLAASWKIRPRPKNSLSRAPPTGCGWRWKVRGPWSSASGHPAHLQPKSTSLIVYAHGRFGRTLCSAGTRLPH